MPRIVWSVLACLICLMTAAPARAQFDSSSVLGTVRDRSGAVVDNAKVTITNSATGVSVTRTTDVHGGFGTITSTFDARQIQFGVKLAF